MIKLINQIFLALDLGGLDSSSIYELTFFDLTMRGFLLAKVAF